MLARPFLNLQSVKNGRPHFLQERRIFQRWSGSDLVGQVVVEFGVHHQTRCVEQFMSKGVAIKRPVLN